MHKILVLKYGNVALEFCQQKHKMTIAVAVVPRF